MIEPGNIVFDIGANNGAWAKQAYSTASPLHLYVFEPVPQIFNELKKTLAGLRARLFDFAISDKNGERTFFYYDNTADSSQLSSFYRRNKTIEKELNLRPRQITVKSQSLDWFLENYSVRGDIDFVKIDTEGSEMDVLKGAAGSLQKNRIGIIQFEYGGTYLEAGVKLRDVYSFLASFNYDIYRIISKGLVHIDRWRDKLENYRYSNYIAILKK